MAWFASLVKCLLCNYRWAAVYELGTDDSRLECPRCHRGNSEVCSDIVARGNPSKEIAELQRLYGDGPE